MSRSAVEVRRAVAADVGPLVGFVQALRAEEPMSSAARSWAAGDAGTAGPEGSRGRLLAALGRRDLALLVAWAGERPVGLAVVRRGALVPLHDDDAMHVEHLAVHAGWRRRGVAAALLEAVAAAAEADGCRDVTCAAPAGDREANRFLARLGFAPAVTHRVTPTAVLRRHLARRGGHEPRAAVRQVLVRRRLQRGRIRATARSAAVSDAGD